MNYIILDNIVSSIILCSSLTLPPNSTISIRLNEIAAGVVQ